LRAAVTLVVKRHAPHLRKRNAFRSAGSLLGHAGRRQKRVGYPRNSHRASRFLWRHRLEAIQLKAAKPL
jgi:hypothetical protein